MVVGDPISANDLFAAPIKYVADEWLIQRRNLYVKHS